MNYDLKWGFYLSALLITTTLYLGYEVISSNTPLPGNIEYGWLKLSSTEIVIQLGLLLGISAIILIEAMRE